MTYCGITMHSRWVIWGSSTAIWENVEHWYLTGPQVSWMLCQNAKSLLQTRAWPKLLFPTWGNVYKGTRMVI